MTKPATTPLDGDDLHLAQLACSQLAKRVQGTLSCGLPGLVTGFPERAFLEAEFQVLDAFAIVLHSIKGKRRTEETLLLEESSSKIVTNLKALQQQLFRYLDTPDHSFLIPEAARNHIADLCDAMTRYAQLVLLDPAPIAKVKTIVLQVFDSLETLETARSSTEGPDTREPA